MVIRELMFSISIANVDCVASVAAVTFLVEHFISISFRVLVQLIDAKSTFLKERFWILRENDRAVIHVTYIVRNKRKAFTFQHCSVSKY